MAGTKFTDNNLKLFYGNLLKHSKWCGEQNYNLQQTYEDMYRATYFTLYNPQGSLFTLEHNEKNKVMKAFNTIFYALPIYTQAATNPVNKPTLTLPEVSNVIHITVIDNRYNRYRYDCYDGLLFDWLLISSLSTYRYNYGPYYGGVYHTHPGSSSSSNRRSDNNDVGQAIALLILIVLALAAVALALVAFYYMLSESLTSVERFVYNEGWLKGGLMLASSLAFGTGGAALTLTLLSGPLMLLALTAGVSPVGVLVFGALAMTLITAGAGCFITNLIYDAVSKNNNQDSMDPSDPDRFRLTEDEEMNLMAKGIDPLKVKCAIVALRGEIATVLESNDKPVPSFLNRIFFSGSAVQPLLDQVRALRAGKLDDVQINEMRFKCKSDAVAVPAYHPQHGAQNIPLALYQ